MLINVEPDVLPQTMELKHTRCENNFCVSQIIAYGIPYGSLTCIEFSEDESIALLSPYYSDNSHIFFIRDNFFIKKTVRYERRNNTLHLV